MCAKPNGKRKRCRESSKLLLIEMAKRVCKAHYKCVKQTSHSTQNLGKVIRKWKKKHDTITALDCPPIRTCWSAGPSGCRTRARSSAGSWRRVCRWLNTRSHVSKRKSRTSWTANWSTGIGTIESLNTAADVEWLGRWDWLRLLTSS